MLRPILVALRAALNPAIIFFRFRCLCCLWGSRAPCNGEDMDGQMKLEGSDLAVRLQALNNPKAVLNRF